jgi:hypothetical protein
MRIAKNGGLVLLGVVIGALVSNLIPARAQVNTQNSRISWTDAGKAASDNFIFVRDSRSGGCWIVVNPQGAIATAPDVACSK